MKLVINHITRAVLDTEKYDRCIQQSANDIIYAQSEYLDRIADNWDVLVAGDYEAVMPIPWRKKYGIRYGYMPAYTAALGVFSSKIDATLFAAFLKAATGIVRFFELSFNAGNRFQIPGFTYRTRMNYVLPLNESYETIRSRYRQNIQRNIKKAAGLGCIIRKDIPVEDVSRLAQSHLQTLTNLTPEDFSKIESLYAYLRKQDRSITYGVYDRNGQLLASCAFFFSAERAYYILVGNHPNGRTLGASHAMIDAFIRDHANTRLVLDFEGSDISNLAFFYSSFGAAEEPYCGINYNGLPWWARLFKK